MAGTSKARGSGEVRRMAAPVVEWLGQLVRRAHWPIALLFAAYLLSGIQAVKADEVAYVLRFGRLLGEARGEQIRRPGLLWALPRPIDEVVRVKVDRVHEVEIDGLWPPPGSARSLAVEPETRDLIDPELEGYSLTGDRNILQFLLIARYRVLDPIAYTLVQVDPHQLLVDVVQATFVRAVGELSVDDLLTERRDRLGSDVLRRAQEELDVLDSGLEIVAVELFDFQPPLAVIPDFLAVETARIDALRTYWEAAQYREEQLPAAEAERGKLVSDAKIYATDLLAKARGQVQAFEDLLVEYRLSPRVVRERLWLEAVEQACAQVGQRKFVQPPAGATYNDDFRITVSTRRPPE